jgi:two-component system sensor histidine kinase DegS
LNETTEQILAAEQDERRRIALFLHDGPVQSLAGVALMLDASLDLIGRGDLGEAQSIIDRALLRTRSTVGELRDLSFNLEPVVLRDHGFVAALDALVESRAREHEIDVTFDVVAAEALGEREQAALYQIAREALEEAVRRGPPSRFEISARADDESLHLVIRDDAPSERRKRALEVLAERARTLGAALAVENEDAGTTMILELPLRSPTNDRAE